ncbi:unnamed protein product, partial [Pleuronectes platessa]
MEWVISSYEVNKLWFGAAVHLPSLFVHKCFLCPSDGNRKHYRFKKDGTDEAGTLRVCFSAKMMRWQPVEDIQRRTKHVECARKGVCGRSQLNAAKETSKRSSSSLDEQ